MPDLRMILCAIDFSPASLAALAYAKLFARVHESVVHLFYVLPVLPIVEGSEGVATQLQEQMRADAERSLGALLATTRREGARAEKHIGFGPPPDAIVHAAEQLGCDLIAVGTTGTTMLRRLLLGSVAERVVQTSPVDVLAVPATRVDPPAPQVRSILCAIDFSGPSERAFASSVDLARKHDAALHVVHVWDSIPGLAVTSELTSAYERDLARDLDALVTRHARAQVPIAAHVRRGIAYVEIVALAAELGVDLVVTGATGRSGLEHFLLGSVAERVVRSSPAPVLAVRSRRRGENVV